MAYVTAAKDYEVLVQTIKQHHSPEIVQCFKFKSHFRDPGESVSTFVPKLRSLAQILSTLEALSMICYRTVWSAVWMMTIFQHCLLSEDKLSFKWALEVAQVHETATKNAQALQCFTDWGNSQIKSQAKEVIIDPSQVLTVWEEQPLCCQVSIPRSQMS